VSFDIEIAKAQVNAVPKLALSYFLDACDEVERVTRERNEAVENANRGFDRLEDEIKGLKAELAEAEERILKLQYERPITSGYGEVQ
jgi:predicted  nucleic acid-binding Zn-ribbon protein